MNIIPQIFGFMVTQSHSITKICLSQYEYIILKDTNHIALEEKVMGFIINSCTKKNKDCTMDDLFKSNFLKEEKETISKNKKEKKK